MQNTTDDQQSLQAILLVSFGVSYPEARSASIDVLYQRMVEAHPDFHVELAYTSEMIREILASRGEFVHNTASALEALAAAGYRRVVVLPMHLIAGSEYHKILAQVNDYRDRFEVLSIGTPLLYYPEDYQAIAEILDTHYVRTPDEAVVFMGHGSEHFMNAAYPALAYEFWRSKRDVFLGTVEGYPSLDDVVNALADRPEIKRVLLAPLLFVAGDHAQNDMAGEEPDSWASVLRACGYEVTCVVQGMGEIPSILNRYCSNFAQIIEAAQQDPAWRAEA